MNKKETWKRLVDLGVVKGKMPRGKWDLIGAYLSTADLISANLSEANLTGAKLSHADLYHADFSRADLTGADLSTFGDIRCDIRCRVYTIDIPLQI